ncbi:unnamed protein product [Lactuca saligna]|uniref:Uncharacterized protein n=1 Tax=Lactuca saligna TaxID=75948 RepID=A0AA36A4Z5_LACSI|nr:unnamed protein product [Lactuca saligna]
MEVKRDSDEINLGDNEGNLDVLADVLSSRSTQTFPPTNPSPTTLVCMKIVISFPSFEEGSRMCSQALHVFTKKQNRETFMFPMTHKVNMEFLKLLME